MKNILMNVHHYGLNVLRVDLTVKNLLKNKKNALKIKKIKLLILLMHMDKIVQFVLKL
jgi:hypothetical protein